VWYSVGIRREDDGNGSASIHAAEKANDASKEILMRAAIAAVCIALALTATAHDQEPRAAVGQCYSACYQRATDDSLLFWRRLERMQDFGVWTDSSHTTQLDYLAWFEDEAHGFCAVAVQYILTMDVCNAGCVDVQNSHPTVSSNARSRWALLFRQEKATMAAWGLWNTSYRDVPTGEDLTDACEELFGLNDTDANPAAMVKRATQKIAQGKADAARAVANNAEEMPLDIDSQ
jgi:hypothetical protein